MGIMTLFLVWFIVNIVLGFMLVAAWIIPGVNFVAGPISLLIVSGVNLGFFIAAMVKMFKKVGSMGKSEGFINGANYVENFHCGKEHDQDQENFHCGKEHEQEI